MSYLKFSFLSISFLFSIITLFADDDVISSKGPQWNHRGIYLNMDAELSFSVGEINDTLDLEIWSCPPIGTARCFMEKTVTVDSQLTRIPIPFELTMEQILTYISEEDINVKVDSLEIENVGEQELMKRELMESYLCDLIFEARILKEGQLLASSPVIHVLWSFDG
jgi:hypothetical protein